MCGIAGFWRQDGTRGSAADLAPSLDRLRHRGPDDEGYVVIDSRTRNAEALGGEETMAEAGPAHYQSRRDVFGDLVLGHRRLSILDLSSRGHQPMASPDGDCWITFNGEVYNFIELREELEAEGESFVSNSDTEVVLRAWLKWGESCLDRFNGDWAFAIADLRDDPVLFLARDRWGVKPLFYVEGDDGFWFASEAKALVGIACDFEPEPLPIVRFLQSGELPAADGGATFFKGVAQLPPGGALKITSSGMEQTRWYDLRERAADISCPDAGTAVSEMGGHVDRAVRLRLRSDVAVGSCLSGGVDSSSIVGSMREQLGADAELGTFSAVYREAGAFNESDWIDKVVGHTGAKAHPTYPDENPLGEVFDRLIWHQDEPFSTPSIFAQWCVMDAARQAGVTVLLDGQAADELLAGYQPGTYQEQNLEFYGKGKWLKLLTSMVSRKRATRLSWRVLWREFNWCKVFGVTGKLPNGEPSGGGTPIDAVGKLGIRREIAAEYLPKTTLDADSLEAKISGGEAKLADWSRKLNSARGARGSRREELQRKIARKRRQLASDRLKLVRLGSDRGRRQRRLVVKARRQGLFDHDLRNYLIAQTTSNNLAQLLRYEDRNSMAFSVEARVPFTDHELVEWAFRRGNDFKIHKGWTKWVLRKAMAGRAPDEILWRRDKVGFETPEMKFAQELLGALDDERQPANSEFLAQYLEPNVVENTCDRVAAGQGTPEDARLVWRWLVLDAWHRAFSAPQLGNPGS